MGTPVFGAGATSTRCQGSGSVTYTATAANNTGLTYSLDASTLAFSGNSIDSGTGAVTYAAGWSGTSTITVSATGCNGPTTATHTVTITPTVGTPVFSLGATSTICQGTGSVTYTATATNNTSLTYSLDATTFAFPGNSIDSGTGAVTYAAGWSGITTITVSAAGCNGSTSATHTVTITPKVETPTAITIASGIEPLCQLPNGTTTTTYASTASNSTSFNWSLSNVLAGSIDASTGVMTWANGFSGTVNIQVTANGCNGPTSPTVIRTVIVNPNNTVEAASSTPTLCINTALTAITIATTTATGIANDGVSEANGLPSGVSATWALDTITIIGTPTVSGIFNYSIPLTGGCGSINATGTITVEDPLVAAGIISGSASVCQGQNGVAYSVPAIANATGYNWAFPSGAFIASGANTNSITLDFSTIALSGDIIVQGTNSCGSGTVSANYPVTVNPLPDSAGTIIGTATVCQGQSGVVFSVPIITNATDYNWILPTGATIVSGVNTNSITVDFSTTASSGNVTVQGTNACGNGTISANHPVTVNTLSIAPTSIAGATIICEGTSTTLSVSGGTAGTAAVAEWFSDSCIGTSAGTGNSITVSPIVNTTYYVRYTGTCNTTTCTSLSITVDPLPIAAGTIIGTPTVCQGQSSVSYSVPTIANATDYTWNLPSGTSIVSGANTNSIIVDFNASATSGNITVRGTNACGNGTVSANYPVIVNLLPDAASTIIGTSTVCQGLNGVSYSVPVIANATGYTWTLPSGATITSGNNSNAITVDFNTSAVSGNITVQGTNACGSGIISANFPVTVNTLSIAPTSIAGAAIICEGTSTTLSVSGGTAGTAAVAEWFSDFCGGTSAGTGNSITVSPIVNTTYYVRYAGTCNTTTCTSLSITVDPLPIAAGTIIGTPTVCQGQSSVSYSIPTIANATGYTWNLPSGASIVSGANTNSIIVDFSASATSDNITVRGTNACGNGIISTNYAVIVNPLPVAAGTIVGTSTVCQGQNGVSYSVPAIANATGYTWTLPSGATIATGNNTNTITLNYSTTATSGNITVQGTNSCGNGTISTTYAVIVNPLPIAAGIITGTATVCQGLSGIVYTVPAITHATGYNWVLPSGASITAGSNTNTITVTFSTSAVSGNITVNGTNGCGNGISANYPVTVNPLPADAGTITGPAVVCQGDIGVVYSVPAIANATDYIWTLPTGATITAGATTDTITVNYSLVATSGIVTVKGNNDCGDGIISANHAVTINITPSITVNYSPPVCSGELVTVTPADGGGNIVPLGTTYSWSLPTVTGGITGATALSGQTNFNQTLTNPTNTTQTASYDVTATTGGCSATTFSVLVTVYPKPIASGTPLTQAKCSGAAIDPINFSLLNGVAGTIDYNWTRDNTGNVTGMAASGSGSTITGNLSNATTSPQTTAFTVIATTQDGCDSLPFTVSVVVNPIPTVLATPATNQTICSGDSITPIALSNPNGVSGTVTYSWTRDNTTNISGIPDGSSTGTFSISGTLTNNTNAIHTTTFTIKATANGCDSATTSVIITVNPKPTVAVSTPSQTVCGGTAIAPVTISNPNSVAGTTYNWTRAANPNLSGMLSGTGTPISGTLVNNGNSDENAVFTVTATANGCPSNTTTTTVIVKPTPTILITPSSQTKCNGVAITTMNITNPNNVTGTNYTWTRDNTNLTGITSPGSGSSISGTLSHIPGSTTTQTTTFTITATAANGCFSTSTATVTVYAPLVAPVISSAQTVCVFSTPATLTSTLPTGGSGSYTYQWQSSPNSSGGPWTNVGTNSLSYSPPLITSSANDLYYQLVVTNSCGTVISNTIWVEVITNVGFTFNLTNTPSGTLCPGSTFTPRISAIHLPTSYVRYTWNSNSSYISPSTGGPVGTTAFLITSSANIGHLTTINNTNATITTTISITPNVYNSSNNAFICSASPSNLNVSIYPKPTATATVPSATICNATSAGIVLDGNITDASTTFGWTRSVNANVTSSQELGSSGAIAAIATYTIPDVLTNTSLTAQTVTYTITPSSNGCSGTAITVTITVAPTVTAGTIAANQTICSGESPVAFTQTAATGAGTLTYQWQNSTTGIPGSYSPISGENTATYTPTGVIVNTWYIRTATFVSSGATPPVVNGVTYTTNSASCSQDTSFVSVTINTINPGSVAGDQTVCSGGDPVAFTSVAPATGTAISYQWQSNTTGCGDVFTDIPSASATLPSGIYDAPSLSVTTYYRRKVTSTLNGKDCVDYSNCITVYVNDVTAGTVGSDQTICGNNPDAFTVITPATGSGVLSYQWQSSTTDCTNGFSNIAINGTSATYDAPPGLSVTTYYRRITTSTLNGVPCSATGNCITVTANSVTAGAISGNRTVCSGGNPAAFTETTAATGTGLTYQWQYSLTSGAGPWTDISGATSATYDEPGPITQNTFYQRVVKASVNGTDCFAYSGFVVVFVNNVTASNVAGDQTLCSNIDPTAFSVLTPASGNGALTYQWQSNIIGCSSLWTNIASATSATYNAPPISQTTYFHTVITSTLNTVQCTAVSNCIVVTSNAKIWNGSSDDDWNTATNWTPNGIPNSINCVIIPNVTNDPEISGTNYNGYGNSLTILNGGKLELESYNNLTITDFVNVNSGGTFNIENSASLIQINDNAINSGNVTVKRTSRPMYRWDYVYHGSPVANDVISQIPSQYDLRYKYVTNKTITGTWTSISSSTLGEGFITRVRNIAPFNVTPTSIDFNYVGVPNNGIIPVSGTTYDGGLTTAYGNSKLLANPYPCAIDAKLFLDDPNNKLFVGGTIYMWTSNTYYIGTGPYSQADYASWNKTGSTGGVPPPGLTPDGKIASGQGFMVQMIADGTLNFENYMRITDYNNNFFRLANHSISEESENHRIWLNMTNGTSFRQALIGYVDGATNEDDRSYDGMTLSNSKIDLYSVLNKKELNIQGRALPFDENDSVDLGYKTNSSGKLTIAIDHVDGLFIENQEIYLEDKLLKIIHNLKQSSYEFSSDVGTFNNRFVLRYANATLGTTNPDAKTGLTSLISNKKIIIHAANKILSVLVYDITGKLIKEYLPKMAVDFFEDEFPFSEGIYLAKIKLEDNSVVSEKLMNTRK